MAIVINYKFRKYLVQFVLILFPAFGNAQGILFEENMIWSQVIEKARVEKKMIFVDCEATWCKPCKVMDKEVYSNDSVGRQINTKFVSFKLQMDSTKFDNEMVRSRYSLADNFKKSYNIKGFPTMLFFSPNGELVHTALGQRRKEEFLILASLALSPETQIVSKINRWRKREALFTDLPILAKQASDAGMDKELVLTIYQDYINNYLEKLPEDLFAVKNNLLFIERTRLLEDPNITNSEGKIFKFCYRNASKADSITGINGFAREVVNGIIFNEMIKPALVIYPDIEPDWVFIENKIRSKFDKHVAKSSVLEARINWYQNAQTWDNYLKYILVQLESEDLNSFRATYINSCAWNIFLHSNDPLLLRKSVKWIDIITPFSLGRPFELVIDTKACILYKLGEVNRAISLEQTIIDMFPVTGKRWQARIDIMKKGEKLWEKVLW